MRFLKGLGIWFLFLVAFVLVFSFILPAGEDGKVHVSGILFYIMMVVPVVFGVVFSKNKSTTHIQNDFGATQGSMIVIMRKRQFAGCAVSHKVYFDGDMIGKIQSGGKLVINNVRGPGVHSILITGIFKQRDLLNVIVSSAQKALYVFDEMDWKKSNIKLSVIKDEEPKKVASIAFDGIRFSEPIENLQSDARTVPFVDAQGKEEEEKYEIQFVEKPTATIEKTISTPVLTHVSVPVKERDPMEIIRIMERRFEEQYQFAYKHLFNLHDCQKMYEQTMKEFDSIELPLMAQMRFEQLCTEYKEKFNITNPFVVVDSMDGHTFEEWCAELLRKNGFVDVEVTPGSGDQGVDVIAVKEGVRYAIQCKCYSSDLSNKPVQEVHTGKSIYKCQVGVVMTNRHFTPGAKEAAEATGVLLWDRDKLEELISGKT